jgi:ribosomal protein L18E
LFKNGKEENKIDLNGYKILGKGDGLKVEIIASQASKTAIDKMQKAGGKIILPEKPVVGKEIKKEESGKDEKEKQKKEEK